MIVVDTNVLAYLWIRGPLSQASSQLLERDDDWHAVTEFLSPLGISQYRLAKDIRIPPRRINEIVLGKRGITADTSLRLARYFGTSERLWLNLQVRFDIEAERDRVGARIHQEVPIFARAV